MDSPVAIETHTGGQKQANAGHAGAQRAPGEAAPAADEDPVVVALDVDAHAPVAAVGRSTRQALHAGLYHGTVGGALRLVQRMTRRLAKPRAVLFTGGSGALLAAELRSARYEPDLLVEGLRTLVGSRA